MRTFVLVAVSSAVLLSTACGSSDGGAAAPPPQSPSPDPGTTPTTASPTPPPSPPPAPSPSPEPSPSPSPSPSPQPDRFVDVERLDRDAECDALAPAGVPAPVNLSASGSSFCGRGLSDGTGHVAAIVQLGRGNTWQAFAPDGRVEQRFGATSDVLPQAEGWQGVLGQNGSTSFSLVTFFGDGSPRRSETPSPSTYSPRSATLAQDPRGGSALSMWGPTGAGSCVGDVRRFDAAGAPAGAPAPTGCNGSLLGVSTGGEALVVEQDFSGAPPLLRWIRPDGTVAASGTDRGFVGGQLVPLLDGSLVVQQGTVTGRRYPHLATAGEPAPAWLAARTNQTFRFTRGNRGYAFFPAAGQQSGDCTQVVELVAPSGRRCARLTFRRDGNACVTGSIDQGWDGTVVQQTSSGACGWRAWPRLLAGD